jgi:hypothetical protein
VWLREHGIDPAVTASTGIASTHIGGSTIHSWSGIGVRERLSDYDLDWIAANERVARRIQKTSVLIIDEVSMLSARTFAMVEAVCREVRRDERPFGGLTIILAVDFFQLPPVSASREKRPQGKLALPEEAHSEFAFISPVWKAVKPVICYLSEQYRQEDAKFLDLLSAVRRGAVSASHRTLLATRRAPLARDGMTQLYSHNADVDRINEAELAKLSGVARRFVMTSRGHKPLVAALTQGCLSPEQLLLKEHATVMFTKNDLARKFVNGTLGRVTGFSKENGFPVVKTNAGRIILAEPLEWSLQDGGRILARIMQVPLRLAWAITIHKSQGTSLDAAHMDLSDAFEYGQGYVALSRVRTLAGLSLAGINERALQVHPAIAEKDEEFRGESEAAREIFTKLSAVELAAMHEHFIRACGGSVAPMRQARKNDQRITSYEITRRLVLRKLSLADMAKERGMTAGTIVSHLEQLRKEKEIDPNRDLAHLSHGQEATIEKIHDALRALGPTPLRSIFDQLDGRVPYETIRVARLLYTE